MGANDVTRAVPDDAAPIIPHKQLASKKTFKTGFGEQYKLIPARPEGQIQSAHIAAFPTIGTFFETPEVISVTDSARVSTAVGAKLIIIRKCGK